MSRGTSDHGLEFLLGFDGRIHHLEKGYWLKFEIARVTATTNRPHGLSYSFTLHAPGGIRLVGFDNAHDVPLKARDLSAAKKAPTTGIARRRTQADLMSSKTLRRCSTTSSTKSNESYATVELACGSRERKHHGGRNEAR